MISRNPKPFIYSAILRILSHSCRSVVKGLYLQSIDLKAPTYLTEEYSGTTTCPKEDDLRQNTCCVRMQISPFHEHEPGLRVYYAHKNSVSLKTVQ